MSAYTGYVSVCLMCCLVILQRQSFADHRGMSTGRGKLYLRLSLVVVAVFAAAVARYLSRVRHRWTRGTYSWQFALVLHLTQWFKHSSSRVVIVFRLNLSIWPLSPFDVNIGGYCLDLTWVLSLFVYEIRWFSLDCCGAVIPRFDAFNFGTLTLNNDFST